MAKVTGIFPDPSHPTAVRVAVDGRTTYTIQRSAAMELKLAPGVEVTAATAAELGLAADAEAAWRSAIGHLSRRGFARGELARWLRRKGHPTEAVETALGRAESSGLVDDVRFAADFAAAGIRQGRGPARIRRDLAARGVSRKIIDTTIAHLPVDDESSLDKIVAMARRRAALLVELPTTTQCRRLLGFLARRGYTGNVARRILERIMR